MATESAAKVQRLKRLESITVRLAPGFCGGMVRTVSNAKLHRRHQDPIFGNKTCYRAF
jgi:hypothetical protein